MICSWCERWSKILYKLFPSTRVCVLGTASKVETSVLDLLRVPPGRS